MPVSQHRERELTTLLPEPVGLTRREGRVSEKAREEERVKMEPL